MMPRTLAKPRTLIAVLTVPVAAVAAVVALALPAGAATAAQKLSVVNSWTQATSGSYNAWNAARLDQGSWSGYRFDWSTDYCSVSPDEPAGFDFRIPCWRHDFGYRNYKALGAFDANKAHVDDAFYFDLRAKCATYSAVVRPACDSLAWTYYTAVDTFGNIVVPQSEIDRATTTKAQAEAATRP